MCRHLYNVYNVYNIIYKTIWKHDHENIYMCVYLHMYIPMVH